jgi:thioredoxin 1
MLNKIFVLICFLITTASFGQTLSENVLFKVYTTDYISENSLKYPTKLFFLDFYADWCGPCKYMDEKVFSDQQIIAKLKNDFIPVKINGDLPISKSIMQKYKVNSYPTYLIIDTKGNTILRMEGALPIKNLIEELNFALKENK